MLHFTAFIIFVAPKIALVPQVLISFFESDIVKSSQGNKAVQQKKIVKEIHKWLIY